MAYKKVLSSLIETSCKALVDKGKIPDTVIVGPGVAAQYVTEAFEELGYELHIISDDALGKYTVIVLDCDDLKQFIYGGDN